MDPVSLPCNILLRTQLLYNLPLTVNDISLLVSNGTNCLNLFHPIRILVSTAATVQLRSIVMSRPMSTCVSVFVHSHNPKTTRPNFTKFFVHVAYGHGLILLLTVLRCYVLPVTDVCLGSFKGNRANDIVAHVQLCKRPHPHDLLRFFHSSKFTAHFQLASTLTNTFTPTQTD